MENQPVKIIQLSDIHLMEDPENELLGVKTESSFDGVLQLLRDNNEMMDMIILTGDVSQDGTDVSYKKIAQKLKSFHVPVYWIPGNHDDGHVMMKVFPLENVNNHKHLILRDWHLILLNTRVPETVEGYLDAGQMQYLKHCLQSYPEHHAVIFLHHHPIAMGCKWLDPIGLKNKDEFWECIESFPRVNAVVFGHVHQESVQKRGNVTCYSTPSTCIQFKPKIDEFKLDKANPGYRWIHLYDGAKLETGVKRTKEYIGKFNENAKGY